jgi:hypothetical protein
LFFLSVVTECCSGAGKTLCWCIRTLGAKGGDFHKLSAINLSNLLSIDYNELGWLGRWVVRRSAPG